MTEKFEKFKSGSENVGEKPKDGESNTEKVDEEIKSIIEDIKEETRKEEKTLGGILGKLNSPELAKLVRAGIFFTTIQAGIMGLGSKPAEASRWGHRYEYNIGRRAAGAVVGIGIGAAARIIFGSIDMVQHRKEIIAQEDMLFERNYQRAFQRYMFEIQNSRTDRERAEVEKNFNIIVERINNDHRAKHTTPDGKVVFGCTHPNGFAMPEDQQGNYPVEHQDRQ